MKRLLIRKLTSKSGTTLIEGIIALLILGVASAMLVYGLYAGIALVNESADIDQYIVDATELAEKTMVQYRTTETYPTPALPYFLTDIVVINTSTHINRNPLNYSASRYSNISYDILDDSGDIVKSGSIKTKPISISVYADEYKTISSNTGRLLYRNVVAYYGVPFM